MPHINAAAALRICVLLSVLPAQYFISQWYGTDSARCIQITEKLTIHRINDCEELHVCGIRSYNMGWTSYAVCGSSRKLELENTDRRLAGLGRRENLIIEHLTMSWSRKESIHVHSPEPEYIQISVGQVIGNKRFGYAGIIVGWDIKANSPEKWLQHKYPPANQGLKDSLSCGILINKANGFGKSTAYIPEEEIAIIMGLEVHHPDRKAYFSGYGGSKYIMQPWLGKISSLMTDVLKCLYM